MDSHPYPAVSRHPHIPSWDAERTPTSHSGAANKKDCAQQQPLASDSFFTRVFGHHHPSSHDHSRANSHSAPLAAPRPQRTLSSTTQSTSRHSRNSSAGTISSPGQPTNSTNIVPITVTMQRRKSLSNHSDSFLRTDSLPTSRAASPIPKVHGDTPSYWNSGKRPSEQGAMPSSSSSSSSVSGRQRSNSGYEDVDPIPHVSKTGTGKGFFRRVLGKKKSRSDLRPDLRNELHSSFSTQSLASPVPSSTTSVAQSSVSVISNYRDNSTHPLDHDTFRFEYKPLHGKIGDRKRSAGSSASGSRKGSTLNEEYTRLNTEFYDTDPNFTTSFFRLGDPSEQWNPPDSWAVDPPQFMDASTPIDEHSEGDLEQEKWDIKKKSYCIRIFRNDSTFATFRVPINSTTNELMDKLAAKHFEEKNKFQLVIVVRNLERVLGPEEHPLEIQKILLEQMGYAEEDRIEDVGRDDNSYLLRFIFRPASAKSLEVLPEIGPKVDLRALNLPRIPPFLYKYASSIISLDVSKNMMMEIPLDFLQQCVDLKHLTLDNNHYSSQPKEFPDMLQRFKALEYINLSCNRFQRLEPVGLDEHEDLRTLEAYNNDLDSLPLSFSKFKFLTSLIVSNNSFASFPDVICQITSLEYLDISFNKIKAFPDEIGDLSSLAYLFAISNEISGPLHDSFGRLHRLKELDIRQNYIDNIDVLSRLPTLQKLLIDYNTVETLEHDFNVPRQLKKLSMYKNCMTQFNPSTYLSNPDGIACQLTELNLSHCKLTSLPNDTFVNMPLLELVDLNSNTLTTIPSSICGLRKLVKLYVQNNHLASLPSDISKLKDLKTLDAQKNNLLALPKEIWLCPSLQTLNCSSNLLKSFPDSYTEPGAALHLPLAPWAETNDIPPTATHSAVQRQLNGNVGQGIVPSNQAQNNPLRRSEMGSLSGHIPNFNPPSFFASPQNRPPPLSLSLRYLFLGDNRLTDDIWSPLSLFLELRTLNLVFNELSEIPAGGLCHQHLYELYLSGNQLTSLPRDDIERLGFLRVLAVNGNKLYTLPTEMRKLRKLLVLDVGNNVLKYNLSNLEFDWNWNLNLGLKYLNLSGNKRLEIKKSKTDPNDTKENILSDFSALTRLRMLGMMDITYMVPLPDESEDRRVRTSPSEVNNMAYGIADWMGPNDHLATWDLVMPKFRNKEDECVFGIFDGQKFPKTEHPKTGTTLTKYLNDKLTQRFTEELRKSEDDDSIVSALRRTFLTLEKDLGALEKDTLKPGALKGMMGASAVVCYISGTKLYVANVGNALAVISRDDGKAVEIAQKHIPLNPAEISRIREAGGFVSNRGLLNAELDVSRGFGYFHLVPVVNANPYVSTHNLKEGDEFVIMASRGLWDCMSYQTAVDIARTEKEDLMAAAQKLRDFAITYGSEDNLMVMVIGVGDLFDKRKKLRNGRGGLLGPGRGVGMDGASLIDDTTILLSKNRRRKEDGPGDSTLARLEREVPPPMNHVALVFTDIKSSTQFWETQPNNMNSAIKIHDAIMRRELRNVGGYEVKTEGDAFMVCFQHVTSALLWSFRVQLELLAADWPTGILDTEEGREIERDNVTLYRGLSVRMGIHCGDPVAEPNPVTNRMDYFGPVVNKAGRIANEADGGQICVSSDVIVALRSVLGVVDNDDFSMEDSLASIAEPYAAAASSNASLELQIIQKSIQKLKELGFHVMKMGERRLKGLETPEMLSYVFPKQLKGRMDLEKRDMITSAVLEPAKSTAFISSPAQSSPLAQDANEDEGLATPPLMEPTKRTIDPVLVLALSNLAIRLERLTSGNPLVYNEAGSTIDLVYTMNAVNGNLSGIISAASTGIGKLLDKYVKEDASDQELVLLMENCVARVENAASSLYLQKVGHFVNVLDRLGEAIELDPMHIMRALQMYSQVAGLTTSPPNMTFP